VYVLRYSSVGFYTTVLLFLVVFPQLVIQHQMQTWGAIGIAAAMASSRGWTHLVRVSAGTASNALRHWFSLSSKRYLRVTSACASGSSCVKARCIYPKSMLLNKFD